MSHVERAHGAAQRRRARLVRHEQRSIAATVATMLHHSAGRKPLPPLVDAATQVQSAAGVMTENMVDIPVVHEQVILQAIPRVVGSLPPVEGFAAPVFDQVHHELFAAGEMPENTVEFPVVQEQVIVQATPEVVGSLPPTEEFFRPVYQFHQEHFSAGVTTENIAEIPVVLEQEIFQAIPRVVGSLPPVDEFTGPVYNPFHQEQFYAGETTMNIANIPRNRCLFRQFLVSLVHFLLLKSLLPTSRGGHHLLLRCGHLYAYSGMSWSSSQTLLPWSRFWTFLCRRWWTNRWCCSQLSTSSFPSWLSKCPRCRRLPAALAWFSPCRSQRNNLVEVPTVLTPTRIALQIAEQIVDTPVEEDDFYDELLEYFCESCEFLKLRANVWQSLGCGDARLLRHSNGAVIFQFWLGEQLIIDDVVQVVGCPRLVLRPGPSGRFWAWTDPEYVGGPSEYVHAVRFASQELARRFHDEWAATG